MTNDLENENNILLNDSPSAAEHSNATASANVGNTSSNENNQNDIPNSKSSTEKNTKREVTSMTTEADFFDKIQSLHCPFTWKPEEHLKSYRHEEIESIMDVDEMFEQAGFKLRRFVIHMIMCYNNFAKRLIDNCIKNLDEMEKMLLTSMKNKSRDVYFTSINDALFHITQSCRVYLLNETNQKEKALQILRKITPYDELNDRNKAGIWAVRANLYVEFGYLGVKAAIEYIKKSTTIDSENPYWCFTKGMYLGRLRRLENGLAVPSVDEIAALEFAMKLKEDASFMAFAAEVYTETANRSMQQYREIFFNCKESEKNELLKQNDKLNTHAAMLFKKSVSLNSNCSHLLFRCGKGLLKLPPPHQDLKLAHDFIKKGLEISYDSSYGNHAMAMYYEKHKKNYDLAKKYLTKASEQRNFGADIDLIRIDFLENRDPESLLNSLLKLFDLYSDKLKHRKIIAEIISYYLFVNYNLIEAINYMKKLLYLINDHDDIVNIYKSGILRQRLPVSLLEILLSDITDRSNQKKLTPDEQDLCKTFFNQLCFQSVTLPVPNSQNLRKKVVSEIKANFKNMHLENIKLSETKTQKEEPRRKDYNPFESRFNREYTKKYYCEAEDEKSKKTVVDEFFEKYEEDMRIKRNMAKDERVNDKKTDNNNSDFKKKSKDTVESLEQYDEITRRENRFRGKLLNDKKTDDHRTSDIEKKSKDSIKTNPHLQEIFSKLKCSKRLNLNSSNESESESEDEKEVVYRLAKQFEKRFDVDDSPEKNSRDRSPRDGKSHHRKSSDDSRSRRHHDSPDKKRSESRESYKSTKKSHRKRSASRDSHISHYSRRKRSTSRDTHVSRSSHRKRSVSRESPVSTRKRRSVSRDSHVSHCKKRSVSRESSVSRRKRSLTKESSRNRSISRESRKSIRKQRSKSSESRKSTRADRHKSHDHQKSKDSNPSTSDERPSSRSHHSSTRSPSNRHKGDRRKNRDYDRKYKSQESLESSTSETSRSSSRSPAKSHKKQGSHRDCRYNSNDTLKGSDHRRRRSDSSDSGRSKRSSGKNRHDRHRSSKSPAKLSNSRESYRSTKESRANRHKDDHYQKRYYEEKRNSKEKSEKSNGSDRDFSDRTERSESYRSKDLNHRDRRCSDEKVEREHLHRQKNEKLSIDSNDIEHSASHSSHIEKERHADEA